MPSHKKERQQKRVQARRERGVLRFSAGRIGELRQILETFLDEDQVYSCTDGYIIVWRPGVEVARINLLTVPDFGGSSYLRYPAMEADTNRLPNQSSW